MSLLSDLANFLFGTDDEPQNEYLVYRTNDGRHHYRFHFSRQSNRRYQIYIVEQPHYNGRATDSHSTHRYWDASQQQYYLCISESLQPTNMTHARNWAKEWAESTERYRKYGITF